MQTSPLSLVRASRDGRLVEIDQDVLDVCARLKEVHPCLGVEYNEESGQFRIYELCRDGRRRTVKWVEELSPDLPDHLRRLLKADYVKEMEAQDAKAERDKDHQLHEMLGPVAEKMAFAARKDRGVKLRAFIPKDI